MKIRNVAIIAHVDHGKTTIVDGLLKQSKIFRENESIMSEELIMDSNDQEKERGITILAKNTAVNYKETKINIIDTPGHADFGGEVERTLNMADGAILVVDAQEGPMPQTKFVLKKALDLGLKVIVLINKIDKPHANISNTISKISDLFLELATHEDQLEFPILFAIGKDGKAWDSEPSNPEQDADLSPVFDAILSFVPEPKIDLDSPFKMLVSALDWDNYKGKLVMGRVAQGKISSGDDILVIKENGNHIKATVDQVFVNQGLQRVTTDQGKSGDIIFLTGIKDGDISDTIASPNDPTPLERIAIAEPTISIVIGPNTSPFMGKEGSILTSRKILERIEKELQTNVAMRFEITEEGNYLISGRGELHISVFLETLRREGFEIEVSKPTVIYKIIDGVKMMPIEELTVDVDNEFVGAVKSEIGQRRGILIGQEELSSDSTRLIFDIATEGIIGLRNILLTLTKGTAIASSTFSRYEPGSSSIQQLRKGAIVSSHSGKAVVYGLVSAHNKGSVFIAPKTMVYEGMVVGLNGRSEDIEVNVCKEKQLTNNRSSGEEATILPQHVDMNLEQMLGFLENDELLEITPESLRIRKKILDATKRRRASR